MEIMHEIQKIGEKLRHRDLKVLNEGIWRKDDFNELLQSKEFKEIFPDRVLDKEFKNLLNPFISNGGKKIIYCKLSRGIDLESNNDLNKKPQYLFSAVTQEMIDVDLEYFGNLNAPERYSVLDILYKPYFYEVLVDGEIGIDIDEEAWYQVTISKPRADKQDTGKIHGRLAFGASPFRFWEIYIEWGKDVTLCKYKLEQKDIVPASNAKIASEMDKLFTNVSASQLRVYRMGQANCIWGYNIINGKRREFAFDLGFPVDFFLQFTKSGVIDKKATGILDDDRIIRKQIKPELIFISHWHQDHYKAAYTLNRDIYLKDPGAMWIAPYKIVGKDESADRLVSYLIKKDTILFVPDKYTGYVQGNYKLYRGNGTYPNGNGLILQTNSTLLPGDCDCQYWDKALIIPSSIKNIIVPHHASEIKTSRERTEAEKRLKTIFSSSRNKAIICVGYNSYGHPNKDVIGMYKNKLNFCEVLETNDETIKKSHFRIKDK